MDENRTFVVVDLETTGGDPKKDRITEIAIFRIVEMEVVDQFVSLVNPEKAIPPEITRLTGIDNEMVRNAPKFYEIAKNIVEITEGAIFVAHNVRFDYGFLQKEFRNLGFTFSRKLLCTIKLSRKAFPGQPTYSLGKLCKSLNIPNEARHRAWGDAQATVDLFKKILVAESVKAHPLPIKEALTFTRIPPHLPKEVVKNLPNETGVYCFHDREGHILYVGKSTQIKSRIYAHFQNAFKQTRSMRLFELIHDISFELTGSELIALLREDYLIKELHPPFNLAQRKKENKFGIFVSENPEGFLCFHIKLLKKGDEPIAVFSARTHAEAALRNKGESYQLCPKLNKLEKGKGACFQFHLHLCQGACVGREAPQDYNERMQAAIAEFSFGIRGKAHFLIVCQGRHPLEKAIVWIKNSSYQGYSYIDTELCTENMTHILNSIPKKKENRDIRKIIRGYIKKHPEEIIPLSTSHAENDSFV